MAFMPNDLQFEWNKFLEGEWTKDPPTKTGEYFLATLDGLHTGSMLIVYDGPDGLGYAMAGSNSKTNLWGGWFWSVPMPKLPPVPL